jgi:hypothetical protein
MGRKVALIIGNSQYDDTGLARLQAPLADVLQLADVLRDPGIGGFDDVQSLVNESFAKTRRAIARFFDDRRRDDLLVLYFSGHGVRDEYGHLHLAVRDTERELLEATAIEANFITSCMDRTASKRLVLILDCCHSGAFAAGSKSAQGASVGTATTFEGNGRGRVVLTATDSTQYAWEGDAVIGTPGASLFTRFLTEGLRTGAADMNQDGVITVDELYDYVYDQVLNQTAKQTPGKWAFGQQGDIVIARTSPTTAGLPPTPPVPPFRAHEMPLVTGRALVAAVGAAALIAAIGVAQFVLRSPDDGETTAADSTAASVTPGATMPAPTVAVPPPHPAPTAPAPAPATTPAPAATSTPAVVPTPSPSPARPAPRPQQPARGPTPAPVTPRPSPAAAPAPAPAAGPAPFDLRPVFPAAPSDVVPAPRPAPAPPPEARPDSGVAARRAEAEVREAIAEYERAVEALDFERLKRVWPSAPDALRRSYQNMRSEAIELTGCSAPDIDP